jgi:tetratricopeptide (TPR) repeat protein
VGLILVIVAWLSVWSNHFENGFHLDDMPVIVTNQSIQHLSTIPGLFANPRVSSVEKDSAAYHPLLSAWFAVDYWLTGDARAFTFQAENFAWFTLDLFTIFALFRLIPGINYLAAAFVTLLFGLHPAIADTVNYALRRGVMMGTFGVVCGMLLWVVWPWRLPQKLPLKLKRVPQHGWDEFLRNNFKRLDYIYVRIIHAPVGLYLWPIIPALLCDAATAVFAPILVAYILLFETKRTVRAAIPAAIICGGYWIFQIAFTWKLGEFSLIPAANYWFTQPWVALRYIYRFFVPLHLSADSDLPAFAHFWDPLAIAGYVGVIALALAAVAAGRRKEWRAVAFGIWWYLLALLPDMMVRHRALEANWRMFLPFVGLALALARMLSMVFERWHARAGGPANNPRRPVVFTLATTVLALALLSVCGWATIERNAIWVSDETLLGNVIKASPGNARAIANYGLLLLARHDAVSGVPFLRYGLQLAPHDPVIEVAMARTYGQAGMSKETDSQFQQALRDGPSYSIPYSAYSQWLLTQSRVSEAIDIASLAVSLDPYDVTGRRTLMDALAENHDWDKQQQLAKETLRLLPNDPDGQRSILVAQTGLDQAVTAQTQAKTEPTVDHYLALSIVYFKDHRYNDSIAACREALKINPSQAEAFSNIAAAYHAMGKLDDTIAALREAVRISPDLPTAKSNLEIELEVKEHQAAQSSR